TAVARAVEALPRDGGVQRARTPRVDGEAVDIEARQAVRTHVGPGRAAVGALLEDVVAGKPDRAPGRARQVHRVGAGEGIEAPVPPTIAGDVEARVRAEDELLRVARIDEQRVVVGRAR